MRTIQEIYFDVPDQIVYFDCPEGRPSSVDSAKMFYWNATDDDRTLTNGLGAPSIETSPDTTLDTASGASQPDPRVLGVTATTGAAVDRTYLLMSADGFREWFDVDAFDDSTITARHPLHNDYASGDTVQSTRIQATIDSTWVSNRNYLLDNGPNPAYRIRWLYTVAGVQHVADSYFKFVRYAGAHGVRPEDVEALATGWLDRLPTDHQQSQGRRLIDEAFRAVKLDLHGIWTDEAMVAETEVMDELTRYKTIVGTEFAKILDGSGTSEIYKSARDAYQARFDSLIRLTTKVPIRDTSGAAAKRPAISLSSR